MCTYHVIELILFGGRTQQVPLFNYCTQKVQQMLV